MICQCEICKKTYPSGYDATKLAILMGRIKGMPYDEESN